MKTIKTMQKLFLFIDWGLEIIKLPTCFVAFLLYFFAMKHPLFNLDINFNVWSEEFNHWHIKVVLAFPCKPFEGMGGT